MSDEPRKCPACGSTEPHIGKPFDVAPGTPQLSVIRFWVCSNSIDGLERMVKAYREATIGDLMRVPI
jgi:hypothetical protein